MRRTPCSPDDYDTVDTHLNNVVSVNSNMREPANTDRTSLLLDNQKHQRISRTDF